MKPEKKTVEEWLNTVDYSDINNYIPSEFALDFINFIKLVNSGSEEHQSPVFHYKMLDQVMGKKQDICNMCYRGSAKTSLLAEYLFLYIALYGGIPRFGDVTIAIYVSDSIENGVKNMRKNLEFRWETSPFLQQYIPEVKFTDIRYEFKNLEGKTLIVKGYGAKTGVRGAKEQGRRVDLAILDDLISDEDARSPTVIKSIEDTVYNALEYALHPTKYKTIWSGTPFNQNDPLYKAVESGAWWVNVYPVCEAFPVPEEEFVGAWDDRHTYAYVKQKYDKALAVGKIAGFNQELMLRIMSDEDRLIEDSDIVWYSRESVIKNKGNYNFYITTDFATSDKDSGDYSVISVWAYNNNGDWLWTDGICKKQTMDKNLDDLFRLSQIYKPQSVGIEVTGQQGGFIPWIKNEMMARNIFFNLASENNSNKPGIRPNTDKIQRFNIVVPLFKAKKVWFPEELKDKQIMQVAMNELRLVSMDGFRSSSDDFSDTISMLSVMNAWKPSHSVEYTYDPKDHLWYEEEVDNSSALEGYII